MVPGSDGTLNRDERRATVPSPSPTPTRDRGPMLALTARRVVDVVPNAAGDGVEIRALGADGLPLLVDLPMEAAMTLLNGLRRLATTERWFAVDGR